MDNILSNGTYMLQPVLTSADFYDYAMYDADGNLAEGIKRGDGNYSYGFQRYYTSAATSAAYQIVPKYVTLKEVNDTATTALYMCSGCKFLERVEGHFNNVTNANSMFYGCSAINYINDDFMNGIRDISGIAGLFNGSACRNLTAWPANSFNNLQYQGATTYFLTNSMTSLQNIDGWATSFEMLSRANIIANFTSDSYSATFTNVTSRLIPIIDHFKNKTVPMTVGTGHMFKWFTNAADYQECVNSPTYSAWV